MHERVDGYTVGKHPLITRMIKGVFNDGPLLPCYTSTWKVQTVLLHKVGVQKKFPSSIRATGARLKKTDGERGMNGNGTGDERTTVLYVRIPFHFNFPVPVFPCYPRKRAYTRTILYICTIRLHTWQNIRRFYYHVRTCSFHSY